MQIGLIEPELRHAEPVGRLIFAGGHACHHCTASAQFLASAANDFFDLLLTDSWPGDRPGEDVIPRARSILPGLPVIMLMPAPRESEIVAALHAGADACLSRPVRGAGMPARVDALLRRAGIRRPPDRRRDVFGGYVSDAAQLTVTFHGQTVALTPKEFRFALVLFGHVSRPVSRAHILEAVWTRRRDVRSRTPDAHASRVRTRLPLRPEYGYCLTPLYGPRLPA